MTNGLIVTSMLGFLLLTASGCDRDDDKKQGFRAENGKYYQSECTLEMSQEQSGLQSAANKRTADNIKAALDKTIAEYNLVALTINDKSPWQDVYPDAKQHPLVGPDGKDADMIDLYETAADSKQFFLWHAGFPGIEVLGKDADGNVGWIRTKPSSYIKHSIPLCGCNHYGAPPVDAAIPVTIYDWIGIEPPKKVSLMLEALYAGERYDIENIPEVGVTCAALEY